MGTGLAALRPISEHTSVPAVEFVDPSRQLCDAHYLFMEHVDAHSLAVLANNLTPPEHVPVSMSA